MELSVELIASILCFVPLSSAKLAMQGVSKSFRQAMQTPQAHAGSREVAFPLQATHSPCISRDILKVMSFVCLGPRRKDFSWVAFLDHLQALACEYGDLQPVSPLQTIQELTLDCLISYGRPLRRCPYDKKISLAHMFPNIKRLHVHSIPLQASVPGQEPESCFLKDIQLMTLQLVVLDNYPYQQMPLLAQNPEWACLDVTVNSLPYGNKMPVTESCVPASTAGIVTSLYLQDIDIDRLDLSEFCHCSKLKSLTFRLWKYSEFFHCFQLFDLARLPKSCCTVKFLNFEPFLQVSESKGWGWVKSPASILTDEAVLELTRVAAL